MKNVDSVDELPPNSKIGYADWKDPQAILNNVDAQLEQYGLEIMLVEDGSDAFQWVIVSK